MGGRVTACSTWIKEGVHGQMDNKCRAVFEFNVERIGGSLEIYKVSYK